MFQVFKKEIDWCGKQLTLETGRMARQADGAVLATMGETTVLCTAVAATSAKPGQDFFPLTVNYQEKTFAAGKIPGGFFKREGLVPNLPCEGVNRQGQASGVANQLARCFFNDWCVIER